MSAKIVVAGIAAFLASSPSHGQSRTAHEKQWREMAPGSQFAPAFGDWEQGGHGKFIRLAAGLNVPFHTHSNDYHAVMISGRMTNLYEGGKVSEVEQGDYWGVTAGLPHGHECVSKEPCLMYTHSSGKFDFKPHDAEGERR